MFKLKTLVFLFFIVIISNTIYSQNKFKFKDESKRAETLKFESVNNLIILSAQLNGENINFLLDSGVNKTKIFGQVKDSTQLESAEYISLRSLGSSEPVKAYKTKNNTIDFGTILGKNLEVFFITDPRFDLAGKLGINVQGIIGYEFLNDFIIRLNYNKKSLRVYQHEKFNRKLRFFDKLDFRLIRKKPHFKVPVEFPSGDNKELVFLIDTGSSDAFWLFEDKNIKAPENSFFDYVGYGLEKAVEGKRSKLKSAKIGKFKLEQPRVAYIDSSSAKLFTADRFKNGIVGSEILKRFVWFFDYRQQLAYLKPGNKFSENSNYDRSGMVLIYVGENITKIRTPVLVKVNKDVKYATTDSEQQFEVRIQVSKIIQINNIRPNSPASKTDIRVGDFILKLNGKSISQMSVDEINKLLSSDEGKRVRIHLKRGDVILKRDIYLRSQLNTINLD